MMMMMMIIIIITLIIMMITVVIPTRFQMMARIKNDQGGGGSVHLWPSWSCRPPGTRCGGSQGSALSRTSDSMGLAAKNGDFDHQSMDWFTGKLKPENPIFNGKIYGFL